MGGHGQGNKAHQLGTPVSFLKGWVEMLKETDIDPRTVAGDPKDVDRLKHVSDRFGKIGSKPQLEEKDLIGQIRTMIEYILQGAAGKVHFSLVDTRLFRRDRRRSRWAGR